MQKYIAIGNLTKDNELRMTQSGKQVLKNTIAIRRDKDNTDFVNFTAFGKTAELLSKYTNKGSKILIEGEIRTGKYEKDSKTVYTSDIVVNTIELLSKPDQKEETQTKEELPTNENNVVYQEDIQISDDDLPF